MRRSLLGLLTVVTVAGLLLVAGCQVFEPVGSLRVASINNGNTLKIDLSDFYTYFNKEDSVWEIIYQVPSDSVQIDMQYAEIGAGLPTWRPYEALLSQATIKFTSKLTLDEAPTYQPLTVQLQQSIPSDPTGKGITTFYMTPVPAMWKQKVFGEGGYINEDDPYFIDLVDLAEVKFTFLGYDSVANQELKAEGKIQAEVGNLYDDPSRFGK